MAQRLLTGIALLSLSLAPTAIARPQPDKAPAPPSEMASVPRYLLFDPGADQILAQHDAQGRFLPASMTKVMTAFVAFELIAQGKLALQDRVIVRPETARLWNGRGTSMYLEAGESVAVEDLLHGIATASANDASVVLAESYAGDVSGWTKLMNQAAAELGMDGSHFNTANGWPDGGKTYVTAADLVKLGKALVERHPALYARFFGKPMFQWRQIDLHSHDPFAGRVKGADGIKTGYTREAGYNFLGSAIRDGRRLFVVVGGARSEAQRAEASRALIEWGFEAWQSHFLVAKGQTVGTAMVQGGAERRVSLQAPRDIRYVTYEGEPGFHAVIRYRGPIEAPIAKGQIVATLTIEKDGGNDGGGPDAQVPLVAAHAVPKAGFLDRLRNGLMNLFS